MAATTTRSRKSKGAGAQKEVRELVLKYLPDMNEEEIRSAIMGETGNDLKLIGEAAKMFPFATEVKRQETTSIWVWWKQLTARASKPGLLMFRRNRSKWMLAMELEEFLKLYAELHDLRKALNTQDDNH